MEPLLSIVIPTRNRQKYCIAAIEDILSYDYPALELCIQDNSDDDQIEKYISNRESDLRMVYKRIPEQIASIFNINDSLKLATGKYVLILGDDDTILPEIFNTVEWADREDYDSICPTVFVPYMWPGALPGREDGSLMIPLFSGKTYTIDIEASLKRLFSKGIIDYQNYCLPKIYHGVVKRIRLQQIEDQIGCYFCGLSPDISGCIALSKIVENHIVIDYPITIAGACNSSTTSQNLQKGHRGELSSAPHFNLRGQYNWDKMVPPFYSVQTIWADSALHAVDAMQIEGLRDKFNYYRLAAFAMVRNRSMWKFALDKTLNDKDNPKNHSRVLTLLGMSWYVSGILLSKLKRSIFKQKTAINREISHVMDIRQAVEIFCSEVKK